MSDIEKTNVDTAPAGEVEVGSAEDVEAIMKKFDRESNVRDWDGTPKKIVRYLLVAFASFVVWMNMFATWDERFRRPLFVGLVILMVFILYPIKKGVTKTNYIPFYDIILAVAGSGAFFYYCFNLDAIVDMGTRIQTLHVVLAIVGILILAECCRRVVGIPMLCVAAVFVGYAYFGAGKTVKSIAYTLFYTTNGVIGIPIGVCSTFIVLFVIFGAFLEATGISNFFIDGANAIAGSSSGGPAKVAVISSALCGMVSGSSVGNTVTTGSVTIPLMKKTGYPGEFAGAVEAAASTGGQIMPPIMGAAAFLMAEIVGVPYSEIIVRAILPAGLYFTGIFLMVHFKAKKMGLRGLRKDELPKGKDIWPKIYLMIPLIALVYMIINGCTMAKSAVYATLYTIVVSMVSREKGSKQLVMALPLLPLLALTFFENSEWLAAQKNVTFIGDNFTTICVVAYLILTVVNVILSLDNRKSLVSYVDALENGGRNCLSVAVACGIAGIIAGIVTQTGLGQLFIKAIVDVAGDNLMIALFLTMLCCIVLGMGVPTTANYIIMSTTTAPILVAMGMNVMAANFFVFYFGIVADITPPVALAAYAGSAIAKAPPMKTAFNATRLAIAAFIIPYIFALNNAMLFIDTTPFQVVQVVISSFLGMFLIASGMMGYMLREIPWILRIVCIAGGLGLIDPGLMTDMIGLAVLVLAIFYQLVFVKRKDAPKVA